MKDLFALIGFGAVAFLGYGLYVSTQQREQQRKLEDQKRFDWFNRRQPI